MIIMEIFKLGILKFLNKIIPKNEHQILFDSDPDFADNSKAMFDFMVLNGLNKSYNLIWLVNEENISNLADKNIKSYHKKSFKGMFQFFRSKYFFTTHNSFLVLKTSKQIFINLWHGMPLKKMGFIEMNVIPHLPARNCDKNHLLISTSTIMKSIISACFYVNPNKVYITGQPRNDKLFLSKKSKENLMNLLKKDLNRYNAVVLFAPTFRKWNSKVEGKTNDLMLNFDGNDGKIFRKFLQDNKILFVIKMHPFEEEYYFKVFKKEKFENLILIKSEMLQKEMLDMHEILGAFDMLVTDYSSIYFDFLLLNKPIIFMPTDYEEYKKSRGFALEPYDFWSPGPKANSYKDLINELNNYINNPEYYAVERETVNNIINRYKDNKSCDRIWELIKGMDD